MAARRRQSGGAGASGPAADAQAGRAVETQLCWSEGQMRLAQQERRLRGTRAAKGAAIDVERRQSERRARRGAQRACTARHARARPPRKYVLGIIPWGRISSAYGYAQALDGTWDGYRKSTGRWAASRSDFGDAIRFVGWYHHQSHIRNNIPLSDTYNLYLAYYTGHGGYERGQFGGGVRQTAKKSAAMAARYEAQLRRCGY